MRRVGQSEAGFSTIEVIVALAVATIALASAYRVIADGMRTAARTAALQSTIVLARSELDAVGRDGRVRSGTSRGAWRDGATWRIDVTDLSQRPPVGNPPRPYWIRLVAFDRSGQPMLQLDTARVAREADP